MILIFDLFVNFDKFIKQMFVIFLFHILRTFVVILISYFKLFVSFDKFI
jgi:hypothetical protein